MVKLEGQMKMNDVFQPFLENIKDSAPWIKLERSFHQEGTVKVNSFLKENKQHISYKQI